MLSNGDDADDWDVNDDRGELFDECELSGGEAEGASESMVRSVALRYDTGWRL